ncbi:MAG TPA: four helix bundle protein [Planctomycetota bacterium]|nr:four helix bundle protein [Planctomycetota bacterium]
MRKPAKTYRDLLVWQKAVGAAGLAYRVTKGFPRAELYGLTAQLRRCAVSVPSNIAEGFGRRGQSEFLRFLLIARGSIFELETRSLIALNVGLMQEDAYTELAAAYDEVERMMETLIRTVQSKR